MYLLEPTTTMVQKRNGEAAWQSFGLTGLSKIGRKGKFLLKNLVFLVKAGDDITKGGQTHSWKQPSIS
jgi:hypothetical protein